jgi:leucyl aminopeptidase (aminopeptidase T)
MNERWTAVAERIVDALGVQRDEVIQVRERTARYEVVQEVLLAVERRGATPLPQLLPPDYLQRLLASTDPAFLARWDQRRLAWEESTDRVLVLAGMEADLTIAPPAAADAWRQATYRLTQVEARRCVPYLAAAVPTVARAEYLGMSLAVLEDVVVPALAAPPEELRWEVGRALAALQGGRTLTVISGPACTLTLQLGDRRWLSDTGTLPAGALAPGVQPVQNLPAGSIYTTVVESAVSGSLWLPRAGAADEAVLRFEGGRIVAIEAAHGGATLGALFDRHSGEPRRVSHIGIGLNPHLRRTIGWPLVDEHRHGCLFIALGENRYLGGQNASSLNVDFTIPHATLLVDGRPVVATGQLLVS